jgi:hypothetical protein
MLLLAGVAAEEGGARNWRERCEKLWRGADQPFELQPSRHPQ